MSQLSIVKEQKSAPLETLISQHKLDYQIPANASASNLVRLIKHEATGTNYTAQNSASIIINSSDDFVDGSKSFMTFDVKADAASTFGSGSAANVIEQISLTSQSGVEIFRLEKVNLMVHTMDHWKRDLAWFRTEGTLQGYTVATTVEDANDSKANPTLFKAGAQVENTYGSDLSTKTTFVLPLANLMPFFGTNQLIPPYFLSGSRLKITFASDVLALVGAASYTISDLSVTFNSVSLTDEVLLELNEQSASQGTEFVFPTWSENSQDYANTSVQLRIEKGISRTIDTFVKVRETDNIVAANDSFVSTDNYSWTNLQFQIGSLYMPNQSLTSAEEAYKITNDVMGKPKNQIRPLKYKVGDAKKGLNIVAMSLEKDDSVKLSGYSVSASRALVVTGTSIAPAGGHRISLFVRHWAVAKARLFEKILISI